ncbi:hypothetical protein AXG93_4170s1170 [Marchantia polymorpha subsp. ruderalis]|uniref:CCHC-type domain-containing protein n=1 Tax=Marchantia polymorpha subsp. ruderalis TaxID=1480154 RepID=A0A176VPD2_MARPO|nr:hypothetical protein AXG93_4170s1170 [Marchantia polymorpha subsp. ruderalis]
MRVEGLTPPVTESFKNIPKTKRHILAIDGGFGGANGARFWPNFFVRIRDEVSYASMAPSLRLPSMMDVRTTCCGNDKYGDCLSLFEALQRKYHQKELFNRLYTSLKLISFKMKDGNSKVQDHIDTFNDLVLDLQNLGEELSDERKSLHLLSSLPPSYKNLSQVFLYRDRKTITYNEAVSALKTNELQQKMMQQSLFSTSSGVALNVNRGRSQKRTTGGDKQKFRSKSRGKSQDKKTLLCWKCGKASHMKKDCRGKLSDSSSANANVASADLEDDLLDDDYAL